MAKNKYQKYVKRLQDAEVYAQQHSADPNTKVGAALYEKGKHLWTETNRLTYSESLDFEAPSDADIIRCSRPLKYLWMDHAEERLFHTSFRNREYYTGKSVYITHWPCPSCARLLTWYSLDKIVIWDQRTASTTDEQVQFVKELFDLLHARLIVVEKEDSDG